MVWKPLHSLVLLACLWWLSDALGQGPQTASDPVPAAASLSPEAEAELRQAAHLRGAALAAMEEENFGKAATYLEQLTILLPDNILPPINLAICQYRLDRHQAALAEIERARRIDPQNPQMLYAFAKLLERDPAERAAWGEILEDFVTYHPSDPRPDYLRASAASEEGRFEAASEAYRKALRKAPDNLVLMVEGLVAAAESEDLEATGDALDAIEDRLNGFEPPTAEIADALRDRLDEGDAEGIRPLAQILRNLLRPTDLYQLGLIPLTGGRGSSGALFPQLEFDPPLPKSIQGGQDIEITFADPSADWQVGDGGPASSLGLYRGEELDQVAALTATGLTVRRVQDGRPEARVLTLEPQPVGPFLSYDFDQDGVSDLVGLVPGSGVVLYIGNHEGAYDHGATIYSQPDTDTIESLFPLELDHDGDLDLFLARRDATDRYLQNNGDGTWSERAGQLGIAGEPATTTDAAVADFDEDGDLDLVVVRNGSAPALYLNSMSGPFEESSANVGLDAVSSGTRGVEAADFNLDGRFDLLFWGTAGMELLVNRVDGFETQGLGATAGGDWRTVVVGDFDNDADQDAVAVDVAAGRLVLLRNRRTRFELEEMQTGNWEPRLMTAGDWDNDGDLDLAALLVDGSGRFWRNDGANLNQWVKLRLRGLYDNNSKNNTQGLFVRLETRVGDTVNTVLGNGGSNLLGLGSARQADVVRAVWTNGLSQTWLQVAAHQDLIEQQVLKGSCPMLFTWNGERFVFHTDLMWRSTLGMRLADGSIGSHLAARDYVLVPEDLLQPAGGDLWLQITEELWETLYIDQTELLVIDHPTDLELVVDERFTPPPYPEQAPIFLLDRQVPPIAATDDRGHDVWDRIYRRDRVYVDDLPLSRYQGLTEGHDLRLTFEDVPAGQPLYLVLWGWIFPTDSSINFALSQGATPRLRPPSLEVMEADGSWRTVVPLLGFPNGKRKSMVIDLTGTLPTGSVTLRIATSMQIYWDAAVLASGTRLENAPGSRLAVADAHLHYRGFSRRYRESSSGPQLFGYDRVSVGSRFRDMRGVFTRYGDVRELLLQGDSHPVIMNAGDELTLRFEAFDLPEVPTGWRRDYVLFTDGWVKDGDLHTAFSRTVRPLPHHGMRRYSPTESSSFFESPTQRDNLDRYQTRVVDDRGFVTEMHHPDAVLLSLQGLDMSPQR